MTLSISCAVPMRTFRVPVPFYLAAVTPQDQDVKLVSTKENETSFVAINRVMLATLSTWGELLKEQNEEVIKWF